MKLLVLLFLPSLSWSAGCSGYGTALPGQFQTIATATIALPLSRYPALITITNNALKTTGNGGLSQSTGFDIAFSDDANTVCTSAQLANSPFGAHQIVTYDGTAGTWTGMVELNGLTAYGPVNALLWIGKASVSDLSSTNVWPSAYKQVYHLQELCTPNGSTAGCFKDATSGAHNSTTGKYPTQSTGVLGKAQTFAAASSQFIAVVSNLTTGTTASLSAWIKPGADPGVSPIFYDARGAGGGGCIIYMLTSSGQNSAYCNPANTSNGSSLFNAAAWHLASLSLSSGTVTSYLDGVSIGTASASISAFSAGTGHIGADVNAATSFYTGLIQEVRVSSAVRTAADFSAEFATMTPTTFFTLANRIWGSTM